MNEIWRHVDARSPFVWNDFEDRTKRFTTRLDSAFSTFKEVDDILPALELNEPGELNWFE